MARARRCLGLAQDEHGGFSSGEPWLPHWRRHMPRVAVDRQEADPASLLHLTRRLIALRSANEALLIGDVADHRGE